MTVRTLHDAANAARCVFADVSVLDNPVLMQRATDALPWSERRAKAVRYRFDEDKRLCVGGGLLLARMLREAGTHDFTLAYGDFEKPFLANEPGIHFNLSHSGSWVACAVSNTPVGVDVEVVCDHGPVVARHCFKPCELEWLDRAQDAAMAFTRLWTRKESFIKYTGTGLSRDPRTLCVLPDQPAEGGAVFHEFSVGNVQGCVCVPAATSVEFLVLNHGWPFEG